MKLHKRIVIMLQAICFTLLGTGCYASAVYYDPYYYDTVYYDPYYYYYDTYWTYTWYDPWGYVYGRGEESPPVYPADGDDIDLNAVGQGMVNHAPNAYGSCAIVSLNGTTVTFQFNQCTGSDSFGLLQGTINVTLSEPTQGTLQLSSTSTDLTINGKPFILDSVATSTTTGATKQLNIVSHSRDPDRVDARDAEIDVTFDHATKCVAVQATGSSSAPGFELDSALNGYQRCKGQCPTAGTITITSGERVLTGTFDGSPTLTVEAQDGESQDFQLDCT